MPLTETRLRALKAKEKSYKVADQRGLYVEVTPSGGKLWRFRYRIGKVEKKLSIGSYPDISLKQAREATYEARHSIASGGEAAQEPGRAQQQHAKSQDHERALEVLREPEPAQCVGVAVVLGEVLKLREEQRQVPACDQQEQEQRHAEHDQQARDREPRRLDQDEAGPLEQGQQPDRRRPGADVVEWGLVERHQPAPSARPATWRIASASGSPRASSAWIAA
ncbi:MAG: Arm DNA-binding domain-containing protein [Sphingomonadaceae bacterium]